jgi:hypothetical protein
MAAMLCPENGSSYTLHGIRVEFLQPGRFEEHNFGHVLNLARNDNVTLKRDDITGSRNANKVIGRISGDVALVVTEKDLANEDLWTQFERSLENDSKSSRAETVVLLVTHKVVLQNIQANSDGDTVQVVHKAGDVVVWDHGSNPVILDVN